MLEIRLIGPIQICSEGQIQNLVKSKKGRWLMALLALRVGREVARDWLAESLWPEQDLLARRSYLAHTLLELRHNLGPDASCILRPDLRHLRLDPAQVTVDLSQLDLAIASDPQTAIALCVAPLFEGCAEPWAIAAREARQNRLSAALERVAASSPPLEAVDLYRRLIRIEPFHENAHQGLMSSLFACGNESEAIRVFREFKLRLHRELNIAPSEETEALYSRISRQSTEPDRQPSAWPHYPNRQLPSPLSDLVGRESDLSTIAALMEGNRLVTLVGFGGSGKTRLAIETGRRLLPVTESGVWFVDLSALMEPAFLAETVGEAIGIGQAGEASWETRIIRNLGVRRLVMILDNCEHLVEPAARLVAALLERCPNLRILATSREPLGVPGEWVFSVPPLEVPKDRQVTATEAVKASAVRLFQERARQVRSEFEVTDLNAPSVAEICRRLDGMPLAIEMAAACIAILPPADLLARLSGMFQLLRSERRLITPRHQTLQGLIDWSYRLLDERERAILARLSVFSGGWTAEAAEQVVAEGSLEQSAVLHVLGSLTAKSLVHADVGDRGSRFRLPETVREYAAERLRDSGETEYMRDRHYAYFLSLARQGKGWRMGLAEAAWFDACDADYDNLRSAIEWGFLKGVDEALAIVAAVSPLWRRHGLSEGLAVLERALALPASDPACSDRLVVMCAYGYHLGTRGSVSNRGISILQEMVAIARKKGDRHELATALGALGDLDRERAPDALHEALQVIGDESDIGRPQLCLCLLGLRELRSARPVTGEPGPDRGLFAAEHYLDRALALAIKQGDVEMEAWAYCSLGGVKDKTSGPAAALDLYSRAERLFRSLGMRSALSYVTWAQAAAHLKMSNFNRACDCALELLVLAVDFDYPAAQFSACLLLAESRWPLGDWAGAVAMIRRAASLHLEHKVPNPPRRLLWRAYEIGAARGDHEFAARIHGALPKDGKHRSMLVDDNRPDAEYHETLDRIRASVTSVIGDRRFADLAEENRQLTDEQAVELVRDAFS